MDLAPTALMRDSRGILSEDALVLIGNSVDARATQRCCTPKKATPRSSSVSISQSCSGSDCNTTIIFMATAAELGVGEAASSHYRTSLPKQPYLASTCMDPKAFRSSEALVIPLLYLVTALLMYNTYIVLHTWVETCDLRQRRMNLQGSRDGIVLLDMQFKCLLWPS